MREVSWEDLKPMSSNKWRHDYYWQVRQAGRQGALQAPAGQARTRRNGLPATRLHCLLTQPGPCPAPACTGMQIPDSPRGVVLMVHGCVHSGYNYWPQSDLCPECRGLPEELSHTMQALKLGYAGAAARQGGAAGLRSRLLLPLAPLPAALPLLMHLPCALICAFSPHPTPPPACLALPAWPRLPCLPAVLAVSSLDRKTGCWSYWNEVFDVLEILQDWRGEYG